MKKEMYQDYESPVVEVVTVEVEKGFAISDGFGEIEEPEID